MEMFWVMLIKPFVGLVLFGSAFAIAWVVMRFIPEGRFKALLGRPLRRGIRERRWPEAPRQ